MAILGTHIGAWGTPDFGITEKIADFFGQGRTGQLGSNLMGDQRLTTKVPTGTGSFVLPGQSGAYGVSSGKVLGVSTNKQPQQPTTNAAPAPQGFNAKDRNQNPGAGWFWDAADGWKQDGGGGGGVDQNAQLMNEINSAFDSVLGSLGGYEDQSRGFINQSAAAQKQGINEQQGYLLDNLNQDRTALEGMQAKSLADLASNLRGQVKNVGRFIGSRGAGNSSATDQSSAFLQKAYGTSRANVMGSYATQFGELTKTENTLRAKTAEMLNNVDTWANSQISSISDQYNQLRANIGLMKGQARIDAINQINAQLQQVQQTRDQYRLNIEQSARDRLAQLNDYKLQLQQSANFDPTQVVAQEYGFNPQTAYTPDEAYYNPYLLKKSTEDQLA